MNNLAASGLVSGNHSYSPRAVGNLPEEIKKTWYTLFIIYFVGFVIGIGGMGIWHFSTFIFC